MQKYVENPCLINGKKFDLRIYVVITSFDPLLVYVFNDGLVRICTKKYDQNPKLMRDSQMSCFIFVLVFESA